MFRFSAKDIKKPKQLDREKGRQQVGHGMWEVLTSTDLYIRHPLLAVADLDAERMRRRDELSSSYITTAAPLSQQQQQQATGPSVPLAPKLTRRQREESGKALREALGDAFIAGGVERAMERARLESLYEVADGVHVWGDFIQVWNRWITSIRQDALSALPPTEALKQVGHREEIEGWLREQVPLLMSEATLASNLAEADLVHVELALGYQFRERRYLVGVLNAGTKSISRFMFERLEWLGDAIIELLASEHWFNQPPTTTSATMSDMKTLTVCNQFLGLLTVFLGCSRYVSGGGWKALCDALSWFLDLSDVEPAERARYAVLPRLMDRLGRIPFEDLVCYLRRRADVERAHRDWTPFWLVVPIPKKGGDFFEALFGAIYQDAGFDYAVVSQ
ncbi:Dicer-2, isoform A, partial [Actinomortierella ambigua]